MSFREVAVIVGHFQGDVGDIGHFRGRSRGVRSYAWDLGVSASQAFRRGT